MNTTPLNFLIGVGATADDGFGGEPSRCTIIAASWSMSTAGPGISACLMLDDGSVVEDVPLRSVVLDAEMVRDRLIPQAMRDARADRRITKAAKALRAAGDATEWAKALDVLYGLVGAYPPAIQDQAGGE